MKAFPISVAISVYANRMYCGFPEYRDLLNHMTGADVRLREIPRARKLAADAIAAQHPWIATVRLPDTDNEKKPKSAKWLRAIETRLGADTLNIDPLPEGAFVPLRNPLAGL